jgi:peroxiredoxin
MMIRVGDLLPDAVFTVMGREGPETRSTSELFRGRAVALFGVAGAYAPTCDKKHLPEIIALTHRIKSLGIDAVACTAVNDIYVLDRWSFEQGNAGRVLMLADGNAEFALKAGLALDLTRFGAGIRSLRYVMLTVNGVVSILNVEEIITDHDKSSATTFCSMVTSMR